MKPFRFSLEKVLKVRQHQTMLCKHALATAQLAAGQAWVTLEKARVARADFEKELQERRTRRMTAQKWAASSEQHDRVVQHEKAAAEKLHQALAEVAGKRAELEEAERRAKTLEKLRDQQMEAHRYGELAEEQAAMDEMAQGAGRDRKGAGLV